MPAKSHSFFLWLAMLNLTIFLGRSKQYFPFPNAEILLILEDELFFELSTTSSMTDAFRLPGTALVPFCIYLYQLMCQQVMTGHQRDRKKVRK